MLLKVFKLIDGETIFGDCEAVYTESGVTEILIKTPFCAKKEGVMPYMADLLTSAPAAVQIHPMNVLWQAPLEDFPKVLEVYTNATSKVIKPESKIII